MKKLLLVGAIALVVIGCVIAAGCTTTSSSDSDDKFVGVWTFTDDLGVNIVVMKSDGTGFTTTIAKENGTRLVKYSKFTWTKNADGTITHNLEMQTSPITLTYDAEKETMVDNLQNTLTKADLITGVWFSEGTDLITNKAAKFTDIFKIDGTGVMAEELDDGTIQVVESAWKKNDDGSYSVTYADGFSDTFVLNQDDGTMSSKVNSAVAIMQRKFDDCHYYHSIIGPWYDKVNKTIVFVNADGTLAGYQNSKKITDGTWKMTDFGKFEIHGISGVTPYGEEIGDNVFIYDSENDTISIAEDEKAVLVRPNMNFEGLTYLKFN